MIINFEYQDQYTNGKWNKQTAICESLAHMIQFYGLHEVGVRYRILSIEE